MAVAEVVACIPVKVHVPVSEDGAALLLFSFLHANNQKKKAERIIKPIIFLIENIFIKTENILLYCRNLTEKYFKNNSQTRQVNRLICSFKLCALRFTL